MSACRLRRSGCGLRRGFCRQRFRFFGLLFGKGFKVKRSGGFLQQLIGLVERQGSCGLPSGDVVATLDHRLVVEADLVETPEGVHEFLPYDAVSHLLHGLQGEVAVTGEFAPVPAVFKLLYHLGAED